MTGDLDIGHSEFLRRRRRRRRPILTLGPEPRILRQMDGESLLDKESHLLIWHHSSVALRVEVLRIARLVSLFWFGFMYVVETDTWRCFVGLQEAICSWPGRTCIQ